MTVLDTITFALRRQWGAVYEWIDEYPTTSYLLIKTTVLTTLVVAFKLADHFDRQRLATLEEEERRYNFFHAKTFKDKSRLSTELDPPHVPISITRTLQEDPPRHRRTFPGTRTFRRRSTGRTFNASLSTIYENE